MTLTCSMSAVKRHSCAVFWRCTKVQQSFHLLSFRSHGSPAEIFPTAFSPPRERQISLACVAALWPPLPTSDICWPNGGMTPHRMHFQFRREHLERFRNPDTDYYSDQQPQIKLASNRSMIFFAPTTSSARFCFCVCGAPSCPSLPVHHSSSA